MKDFNEVCRELGHTFECERDFDRAEDWYAKGVEAGERQVEALKSSELLIAEKLAEKFHTKYEELAPTYKYETRKESAVPWKDVPENNKRLMIRVCREILQGT